MTQETPNHLQNPNDDANDKIVSKDEKTDPKKPARKKKKSM